MDNLFDSDWYLERYPDVASSGINPLEHYLNHGAAEGRDPNPLFDSDWYLERYPDVASSGINPLEHYLNHGAAEGRDPNPLFDSDWYLERYPDVASSGINPLEHYLNHGAAEGRDPNPLFDSDWYLERYPDVVESGLIPVEHFLLFGAKELRDPNPLFISHWYAKRYSDVIESGLIPVEHFLLFGAKEERQPSPLFLKESLHALPSLGLGDCSYWRNPVTGKSPRVTIVIPVHGKWHWTERCLIALYNSEARELAEIVLVDDTSPDRTRERVREFPAITVRELSVNLGFTKASNAGAKDVKTEFILFLNNDTEPLPGFLDALLVEADQNKEVAIVGSKLVYPDGLLQECGSIIWADGSGHNFGKFGEIDDPEFQLVYDVDYCSGASILVRTSFWEEVGGFDERYSPAYYEDVDLAFSARKLGYRVLVSPHSVVIHHEGGSHGTDTSSGVKANQLINQKKFVDKWAVEIADQFKHDLVPPRRAIHRATRSKPIAICIDEMLITPELDAGSFRSLKISETLLEMGYEVVYVSERDDLFGKPARELRERGFLVITGVDKFKKFIAAERDWVEAIFVARVGTAMRWLSILDESCPEVPKVFDTVDLHHLREEKQAELLDSLDLRMRAAGTKRREEYVMSNTNATLVVNQNEVTYIKDLALNVDVRYLGLIYETSDHVNKWKDRSGLSFVGSFQHPPNQDGLEWFFAEVWPLVNSRIRNDGIEIIGVNPPKSLLELEDDQIHFLGFVPQTYSYLQSARLSIAPLRFGAGAKGKVCDAWANGLPVVGTVEALDGMISSENPAFLVGNSAREFAEVINNVYLDENQWNTASVASLNLVKTDYSKSFARIQLERLFQDF